MSKSQQNISLRDGRATIEFYTIIDVPRVKQNVLAQAMGYTCVSNCFRLGFAMLSYGGAFAWKHLLAFMHMAHYDRESIMHTIAHYRPIFLDFYED